ncbi:MAG: hypothetical protein ACOYD1_07975 [Candidatus Nanopelagicales bacterium]
MTGWIGWSYVLTAVGVFGLFLAGRRDWRCSFINQHDTDAADPAWRRRIGAMHALRRAVAASPTTERTPS